MTADEADALRECAKAQNLSAAALERLEWILAVCADGKAMTDVCRQYRISRSTFLRWRRRFDPDHPEKLEEHSRRPKHVRRPTVPPHVIHLICEYRQRGMAMGKRRIAALLRREHGIVLSPSTVARVLERAGMLHTERTAEIGEARLVSADEQPLDVPLLLPLAEEYSPESPDA